MGPIYITIDLYSRPNQSNEANLGLYSQRVHMTTDLFNNRGDVSIGLYSQDDLIGLQQQICLIIKVT